MTRDLRPYSDEERAAILQEKRKVRFARIDALPPELRDLVHKYSFNVVNAFMQHGIQRPNIIRHLVETVLDEFSPTRGSYAKQGIRTNVEDRGEKPS